MVPSTVRVPSGMQAKPDGQSSAAQTNSGSTTPLLASSCAGTHGLASRPSSPIGPG
jgi:hypothetical protein